MKIGFALIPERNYLEKVVKIENEINQQAGFKSKLGHESNIPHITLYQGNVEDNINYKSIAEHLVQKYEKISSECAVSFTNVVYVQEGWYFLECYPSKEIKDLHSYCLPFVSTFIVIDENRLKRDTWFLSKSEVDGIKNYGYRYAADAFYPHITIGKNGRDLDVSLLKLLNIKMSSLPRKAKIEKFVVYEMGELGECKRILHEIKVGN